MPARPVLALVALALSLAACGSDSPASATKVSIKAGDSSCDLATTTFEPGSVAFDVSNVGKDTTEVYVYGKGSGDAFDKVVGEAENIAPGTSRDLSVDLTGGTYQVACKPGQKGDGVRTEITVSGAVATSAAKYDREVKLSTRDFSFQGLTDLSAKVGERVEFSLKNLSQDTAHEFEVLGPDGKAIGEIGPTDPGKTSDTILEFTVAGTYRFLCGIADHADKGMKGTFTVS